MRTEEFLRDIQEKHGDLAAQSVMICMQAYAALSLVEALERSAVRDALSAQLAALAATTLVVLTEVGAAAQKDDWFKAHNILFAARQALALAEREIDGGADVPHNLQ